MGRLGRGWHRPVSPVCVSTSAFLAKLGVSRRAHTSTGSGDRDGAGPGLIYSGRGGGRGGAQMTRHETEKRGRWWRRRRRRLVSSEFTGSLLRCVFIL